MTGAESKKLLALIKDKKLGITAIGVYLYLDMTQGDILTYAKISTDLGKSLNVIKGHIKQMEFLHILTRTSQRRGVIFQISPTKLWVPTGIYNIHTNISIYKEEIDEILEDLSNVANHNFKASEQTRELITARLNDRHTVAEFKQVHKNKAVWLTSEKMHTYFRPATLYTKKHFANYLDEVHKFDSSKKTSSKWKDAGYTNEIEATKRKLKQIDIDIEEDVI